ncbi:MAG: heavy metal translocating P-type ATPase metal-binding domain-containing protein, partial [Myxococcota bacterium]|nr:heavy metal translocating P-type ATPase metal-binding domain-containing protein [Myxococcota bacterium]
MANALPNAESATDHCAHCGAELASELSDDSGRRFCCAGCLTVYAAIHAAGLEAFYADREISAVRARPVRPSGRRFAEFDDPALATRFDVHPDGSCSIELSLEGVHCAACVWLVESLPRVVAGVQESRLDFGRATASVRW